jgi:GNAT superfamily N-acetyltransferase
MIAAVPETAHGIRLAPLRAEDRDAAARVVAAAMLRNPIHRAVHGFDDVERQEGLERMFGALLHAHGRPGFVAWRDGAIVGAAVHGPPGACPMPAARRAWLQRRLASLPSAQRIHAWRAAWAQHEPREPHWHLGPLGVAPEAQRLGVGGALLCAFLAEVDAHRGLAYLETDTARNVTWYARHGFAPAGAAGVLGVACTFMRRAPRAA